MVGQKQGMDPGVARVTRDTMSAQVDALATIVADLALTKLAANNPAAWGIAPGEPTVAPWSIGAIAASHASVTSAESAARVLLRRVSAEADAQDAASANHFSKLGGARPYVDTVRDVRNIIAVPRSILETPAALRMLRNNPALWRTLVQVNTWGVRNTVTASTALTKYTRALATPRWIRGSYQSASNLKWQNYLDPKFMHSVGLHAAPPAWTNVMHASVGFADKAKVVAAAASKGFGVLGVGVGMLNLATGVTGAMDGDVSSQDAWAIADGVVGTITSIGSFAPPPAGLVFAGVGAAYTAGRWLFGADANGNTGIDKIGDFGSAAAGVASDVASDVASNVSSTVSDGAEAVGDFVEDVWPW